MEHNEKYRLLGVDPGTNALGYAVIEIERRKIRLIDMGVIHMKSLASQQLKLKRIFEKLQEIIDLFGPSELAIEAPFYGKNVQSMLKLGRAQGVAIAAAMTKGLDVTEYAPKKIKLAITGNGNASKEQVAAMLENILHQKMVETSLDATDALATVICHFYQQKHLKKGAKRYDGWAAFAKNNPERLK